jgi:hypothetical protein
LVKSGEAATASAREQANGEAEVQVDQDAAKAGQQGAPTQSNVLAPQVRQDDSSPRTKSGLNVTLTVDSSSDPDKLQKQLELLRKFGVI